MAIEFEDNSLKVKEAISEAVLAFLYEAGGEVVSQAQRNSPVASGQLKDSWKYEAFEGEQKVQIGSPLENAIWNEFGTGQYALNGDGRKTPWHYQDVEGKWHTTTGKRPNRSLHNAIEFVKPKLQGALAEKLKGASK